MTSLCHITTVHPRYDTRILLKECVTLAKSLSLHRVDLFVADGKGDEIYDDVHIRDMGLLPKNRFARLLIGNWRAFRHSVKGSHEIIHYHDPELVFMALALTIFRKKVIYDVHEDLPRDILSKDYLDPRVKYFLSKAASFVEWIVGRILFGFVAATPVIAKRFPSAKTITVQNFPIKNELSSSSSKPISERPRNVTYVGAIAEVRCVNEMIDALAFTDAILLLGGNFSPSSLQIKISKNQNFNQVKHYGWINRDMMADILGQSRAGLVLFKNRPNYDNSQPNKLFEYMSAGIPIIASNFPAWKPFIEDTESGVMVDPDSPKAIGQAIEFLLNNPEIAEKMGNNGRRAVDTLFNWDIEAIKLVNYYLSISSV